MARPIHKLSALAVTRANKFGYLSDGGGLYLRVGPTSAKSWVFRFKEQGRTHEMGLGPLHTVGLAEARQKALECRKLRLGHINPIEARRAGEARVQAAAAKQVTFRECAEQYIGTHRAGWTPNHAADWESSVRLYADPLFGDVPVAAIDLSLVLKALEPIWTTKTVTASRLRGRIETVLGWATTRGYRTGDNPARWKGHLENVLPEPGKVRRVEHHAALPYAEIGTFMIELRQRDTVGARALEFAILTAVRSGEAIEARWSEMNMVERLWSVPADRMKSDREHRVPLSNRAMAILGEMAELRANTYVFPGQRAGKPLNRSTSFLQVLHRMGCHNLTAHGFRSTFRDWAAERTSYPAEVAEMALAHRVGSAV